MPRVLAHVAGDVRELHRDAEVTGPRHDVGRAAAHDERHHGAHAPRDARRVGVELVQGLVPASRRVPRHSLEQRVEQDPRHALARDDRRERAIDGASVGAPGVGAREARAEGRDGRHVGVRVGVHLVVRDAAERIEHGGGFAHARRQERRRRRERLRAGAEERAARLQVGARQRVRGVAAVALAGACGLAFRPHPALRGTSRGRGPARTTGRRGRRRRGGYPRRPGTGRAPPRSRCAAGSRRSG